MGNVLFLIFRYEIDGMYRNINAVNYFKIGIDDMWQDPQNGKGGRIVFQIDKDSQKYEETYQWIIFYFLGNSNEQSQDINGIRIISP